MIPWCCPVCLTVINLPDSFRRVNCTCGSVVNRDGTIAVRGTPPVPIAAELLSSRQATCDQCVQYRQTRCRILDHGCRRTYQGELYSPDGACPLALWPAQ